AGATTKIDQGEVPATHGAGLSQRADIVAARRALQTMKQQQSLAGACATREVIDVEEVLIRGVDPRAFKAARWRTRRAQCRVQRLRMTAGEPARRLVRTRERLLGHVR